MRFVNNTKCIKAVNISRHSVSYEEECKALCNIGEDEFIGFIDKPVKINVVVPDNDISEKFAKSVLNRWKDFSNVKVCFRTNFNNSTKETLHDLSDKNIKVLGSLGDFENRGFCDVCDTISFSGKNGQKYLYHRGLPTTSIKFADIIQVNDIIIFPNGELSYDWNRNLEGIEEMCNQFDLTFISRNHSHSMATPSHFAGSSCGGGFFSSCGFGRC